MAFYKVVDGELVNAPNFVDAPDYTLLAENHAEHEYPIDGWRWFDTSDLAKAELGLSDEQLAQLDKNTQSTDMPTP